MKLKGVVLALTIGLMVPVGAVSQDAGEGSISQKQTRDMAFSQLSEKEKKTVIAMLKKLFKEAKGKAEDSIRDNGGMVPYGYAMNHAGEGQFLHIDPEQEMRAEVAAHAVQKTIVTNALQGNLAASGLFMTMGVPSGLDEETRQQLEESIKGDRGIEDVRYLMVELQHLGGLGLLMTVPYWQQDDGKWVFGKPASERIDPELQQTVRGMIRKAVEKQRSGG